MWDFNSMSAPDIKYLIAVHGGVGYHSPSKEGEYKSCCTRACMKAESVLKTGGSAVDAVTAAIKELEDAKCMNAGIGSNLSLDGTVECDASIMDGQSMLFGGVGCISDVKNPIEVARELIKVQKEGTMSLGRVPPSIMVGPGASKWAQEQGIPLVQPEVLYTKDTLKTYGNYKRRLESAEDRQKSKRTKLISQGSPPKNCPSTTASNDHSAIENSGCCSNGIQDTVGAVCLDCNGNLAAGVSSGGISLKQPGRLGLASKGFHFLQVFSNCPCIGQAAVHGAGCWCHGGQEGLPAVAVATSGTGEHVIRTLLAKECADCIQRAEMASQALHDVFTHRFLDSAYLSDIDEKFGGALVLKTEEDSPLVELLWGHTADSMCVGFMSSKDRKPKVEIMRLPSDKQPGRTFTMQGRNFVL